jgi:predicted dienelactone hydrolase
MGRLTLLLTGLVLWVVAFTTTSNSEDCTKPGPFAVGLQKFTIPDTSGNHPMATMVWYPAAGPAQDPTAASVNAIMDAPKAKCGPYPLVVVIHGISGQGTMFGAVGRHLASHGLVVAAADYDTGPLPDGDTWGDQNAVRQLYDRPASVMRVIGYVDQLSAPDGELAGVIDTSRIGVWGLSTGGSTAFQAAGAQVDLKALDAWCADKKEDANASETCQFVGSEQALAKRNGVADPFAAPMPPIWDHRVAALVAAAPGGELHAFGDKGIAAVKLPTLIMFASDDHVVSPKFNALWAYDGIGSPDKALAVFDRGGHTLFMYSSAPHFLEATALATAFFLAILKGNPADRAALMPNAVSFPGLSYRTTLH